MTEIAEELRYPIGRFVYDPDVTPEKRKAWITEIARLPWKLRSIIAGWNEEQLNAPYRPEGWTVRQTIHHLADSHMNSLIRFKLALTENNPTIKPYDEAAWAELYDGKSAPIELSLKLLDVMHERWSMLLQSIQPEQWSRTFNHPERGTVTLDNTLQLYVWHGHHHLAQISALAERKAWVKKQQ